MSWWRGLTGSQKIVMVLGPLILLIAALSPLTGNHQPQPMSSKQSVSISKDGQAGAATVQFFALSQDPGRPDSVSFSINGGDVQHAYCNDTVAVPLGTTSVSLKAGCDIGADGFGALRLTSPSDSSVHISAPTGP